MRTSKLVTLLALAAFAAAASAQERPSEEDIFGGPAAPEQPSSPPGPGTGEKPPPPAGTLIPRDREDWLDVGGQLQLRALASGSEDADVADWPFASPNLLDVYLDARPNDRVRAFVLGRLRYDPTLPPSGEGGTLPTGGAGGFTLDGVTTESIGNPGAVLDQLWVKFDVSRRAFVTAGRQHVKWGVGRFWNPTDYLHRVPRDPLATFDARTGTTMLRVHVPWEKRGWNLYGVALLEDLAGDPWEPASRLGRIGGGGRAELVLGPAELGLDAVAQSGHHPRYGIDLSTGVWDLDLYAEAALRSGGDGPRWVRGGTAPAPFPELAGWRRDDARGLTPQIVVGGTWAWKYSDEDALTLGAEYFYNDLGYDDPEVYPFLLLGAPAFDLSGPIPLATQQDPAAFRSFYLGKHYAAANLFLSQPGRWNDTTFIFSVIGNLSDRSYIARFDTSVRVLTYMTVETFVAGHFGREGGEFRLVLPPGLNDLVPQGSGFPAGAPLIDVGVALRVSL